MNAQPHLFAWLNREEVGRWLVGGKGASLSRLAMLGAPVPRAGALTTTAYSALADGLGLPRRARDVDSGARPAIRAAILDGPLPEAVSDALRQTFDAFVALAGDDLALAVRSSATAEDSETLSFAGLHDTILDVRTWPAFEAAVRRCWVSLWSDRAVSYRLANGLGDAPVEIAVVVQELVRSDVSFVVFTSDPVSGRADRLVISATWGLGEAVVSGLVDPDHIVVDPTGRVLTYDVGTKHVMIVPGAAPGDGVSQAPVPRMLQRAHVLAPGQIDEIATMARGLSRRLGYAADLEGGIVRGSIYLFQARPITTLAAPAGAGAPPALHLIPIPDADPLARAHRH
jgi:pyruvate,water dikinase